MPRKARINQPGLSHYIMSRTFNDVALNVDDNRTRSISPRELRRRSRGGKASDARKVFSYVSRRVYEFPVKDTGRYLGISGPPVSISVPEGEKSVKSGRVLVNI